MEKETRYNDILLSTDLDDLYENGDLAVGDGREGDCVCILKLNSGQLKSDPILGPNLVLMLNGKVTETDLKQIIELHLKRDSKEAKSILLTEEGFRVKL